MMRYFTDQELCKSNTAERLGIWNWPSEEVLNNLHSLVEHVLDPAREMLGRPVFVNSGYRSKETNIAVGGTKNSQHLRGEAADVYCKGNLMDLFNVLRKTDFDQLILYRKKRFIHVSYTTRRKNRHQIIYS